jgi:hypothetical protein
MNNFGVRTLIYRTVVTIATGAALAGCATHRASDTSEARGAAASVTATAPKTSGNTDLTLSFIGDNILGTDDRFDQSTSLPARWAASGNDPKYFYRNVAPILTADDLTVANVEVVLSNRGTKIDKGTDEHYHFRGDPKLAATLPIGGIDVATIANNHTGDYGPIGFQDTVANLRKAGVPVFGDMYDQHLTHIAEVKGVKVGLFGMQAWNDGAENRAAIRERITDLRKRGAQVVIPEFHWGIESQNRPYEVQTSLAKYAIDNGADMVIGSHPHVLQSMAQYKGKFIAFSLANFAFGGNNNPHDKRTMILQTKVHLSDGAVRGVDYRVIPTRVSSTPDYNDFVPTPYGPVDSAQEIAFLNGISPTLHGTVSQDFTPVPAR